MLPDKEIMRNKVIILSFMILALVVFLSTNDDDAYAMKISCADDINLQEFLICKYVKEWNESEEYEEKVLEEIATHVGELNSKNISQYYKIVREKVEQENPGLKEKCEELRKWVLEQVRIDKEKKN